MKKPMPGVYLESELLDSSAFRKLTKAEILVYLRFLRKRQIKTTPFGRGRREAKNIVNNGEIIFPYREAEAKLQITQSTFRKAIDHLVEYGFLDIAKSGSFNPYGKNEPSLYAVSERWKKFGTPDFVRGIREKSGVHHGYQDPEKQKHRKKTR